MDLSGKINPPTWGGGLHQFKITNTISYFRHVYILKTKDEALEQFKNYYCSATNLQKTIISIVTDGGASSLLTNSRNSSPTTESHFTSRLRTPRGKTQ
jgi:hypothetical protein